ncbi:DUF3667 domain-containing protein [Owenweeksia hongkongensis]|uniref:DUF3667 domain-containing protein n=1 Tax=Owenweeksia hongkongensis TaxID=253245 RepID=UPI003A92AB69
MERDEMTLRHFFGSVWNAITFTDVKFLRSVLALLFRPGKLTVEFFAGRRKLYTAPLALFFFINLVYFIYQPVDALNSSLRSQTEGQFYSEWASGVVNDYLSKESIAPEDFVSTYNQMTGQVSKLFLVIFILIFAVGVALVNFRRGELFYVHLITATHFVSFAILSMLILLPLVGSLLIWIYLIITQQSSWNLNPNMGPITFTILLILAVYGYAMQKRLYQQGFFVNLIKAALLIVFFALSVVVYRFFLFVVTMQLV